MKTILKNAANAVSHSSVIKTVNRPSLTHSLSGGDSDAVEATPITASHLNPDIN